MSDTPLSTYPEHAVDLSIDSVQDGTRIRVAVRGEADISTLSDLDRELSAVDLHGATAVQLDLAGLQFADVATIRRLIVFAREVRRTGHDVTTCGGTPTFREVSNYLDEEDDLGLT